MTVPPYATKRALETYLGNGVKVHRVFVNGEEMIEEPISLTERAGKFLEGHTPTHQKLAVLLIQIRNETLRECAEICHRSGGAYVAQARIKKLVIE